MWNRMDVGRVIVCLSLLFGSFDIVFAQEIEAPEGDIPTWLEGYGYQDDLNYDGASGGSFDSGTPSSGSMNSAGGAADSSNGMRTCDGGGCDALGTGGPCQCGSFFCRGQLTGDWLGHRTALQENGITYRGRVTQFFFGVGGGVNPQNVPPQFEALGVAGGDAFEYTGNSRHDFLVDLDKFGGLPYSKFIFTLENIWGRWGNVSFETGAFSPVIFNSVMPVDLEANGVPRVTNFLLVQPLSESFILTAGKTRTVGIADNNVFAGGDGSDQFLNQSLVANPILVPQIPFSTFSVGAIMPQEWGNIAISVLDPTERSTEFMDFGSLFSEGAIIFGQVKLDTNFFDKPGEQHIGGFYKNVDLQDLAFATNYPTYPYPPGSPGNPFLTKPDTYGLFWGFDQYVATYGAADAAGNTEGWGIFGRAGMADGGTGNPNFAAWHVSAGIGGNSPLRCRRGKGDRFGIGYAYTGTSTEFGAIPQFLFAPRDAQLIESYYLYRLTPSIEVTPDIQWIRGMLGGLTDGDDALVGGIRMNIIL